MFKCQYAIFNGNQPLNQKGLDMTNLLTGDRMSWHVIGRRFSTAVHLQHVQALAGHY